MKIVHIITSMTSGGAQSLLIELIKNWPQAEDHHIVISLREKAAWVNKLEELGVETICLNINPSSLIALIKLPHLVQILKNQKPDVVQTWLYHADLLGGLAAHLAGKIPVVWGIHHSDVKRGIKFSTKLVVQLNSFLSRYLPHTIICCSDSAYQSHLNAGFDRSKLQVISNGANLKKFQPNKNSRNVLLNELNLAPNSHLIGLFARFHPLKDQFSFIQAASLLIKHKPNSHFILAGQDITPNNKQLSQWLRVHPQLNGHVHLLGLRDDMPALLQAVDILTLSSISEALPMVICEAMACETICVATDVGDCALLIGDTGWIVPPANPLRLAEAWLDVLNTDPKKLAVLSALARKRVSDFYNLENISKHYKTIYEKIISDSQA